MPASLLTCKSCKLPRPRTFAAPSPSSLSSSSSCLVLMCREASVRTWPAGTQGVREGQGGVGRGVEGQRRGRCVPPVAASGPRHAVTAVHGAPASVAPSGLLHGQPQVRHMPPRDQPATPARTAYVSYTRCLARKRTQRVPCLQPKPYNTHAGTLAPAAPSPITRQSAAVLPRSAVTHPAAPPGRL